MSYVQTKRFWVAILIALLIGSGCTVKKSVDTAKNKSAENKSFYKTAPLKTVQVDDIKMAYKVFGKGQPLILIMGYSGTMDMWQPEVLRKLSKKYRVIVFDNRGMGKTSAGTKEFSIDQFAADTAGLLDALKIKNADVLGWSMGTNIALELILDDPNKVDKLVLYAADCGGKEAIQPAPDVVKAMTDSTGTPEERGMATLKTLFPESWLKAHPDPKTYFTFPQESSSDANMARQWTATMQWPGAYSRLSQIVNPPLVITGSEDINTPVENSYILAKRLPAVCLVKIKGGGHGVMYQYPEEFSEYVIEFLDSTHRQKDELAIKFY